MKTALEVIQRIKNHDLFHMMSDSHSVWKKGNDDVKEIKLAYLRLPKEEQDVVTAYANKEILRDQFKNPQAREIANNFYLMFTEQ